MTATEEQHHTPPVLLASTSPRRARILRESSIAHRVIDPGIDDGEMTYSGVGPAPWAAALAYCKARAGLERWRDDAGGAALNVSWVIGADTICVHESEVIGQARSIEHARSILMRFDNDAHTVISGVAMIDPSTNARRLFVDSARVWWSGVGQEAIEAYLGTDQWRGKAGAYNIGERVSAGWPIRWEGSAHTIAGLPLERLIERLRAEGAPKEVRSGAAS